MRCVSSTRMALEMRKMSGSAVGLHSARRLGVSIGLVQPGASMRSLPARHPCPNHTRI